MSIDLPFDKRGYESSLIGLLRSKMVARGATKEGRKMDGRLFGDTKAEKEGE